MDLDGNQDFISNLKFNGSSLITGAGTLTLDSRATVTSLANSQTATVSRTLDLNAANHTFDVADGGAAIDLDVSANIADGSLTKTGGGTLRMSGSNTFSGGLTVNAGALIYKSGTLLGNLSLASAATLMIDWEARRRGRNTTTSAYPANWPWAAR